MNTATTGPVRTPHAGETDRLTIAFRAAAAAAIAMGIAICIAPSIASSFSGPLFVLLLTVWALAVAGAGLIAAPRLFRPGLDLRQKVVSAVGLVGIGGALIATVELALVRSLFGRPALLWNIDWRYHLNHAQAVARFGDVRHALDYSGAPVDYHVGPAWIAGMVQRTLGVGLTPTLYGIVPGLSILTLVFGVLLLSRENGIGYRSAAAGLGLAASFPLLQATVIGLFRTFPSAVQSPDSYFLGPVLMLNSLMAAAVGLSGAALLLSRQSPIGMRVLGMLGLAAIIQLKPQFFIAIGLWVGLLALWRWSGGGGEAREWTTLGLALGALAGAVLFLRLAPILEGRIASPAFAPGATGYSSGEFLREPLRIPTLLFIATVAGVVWDRGRPTDRRRLVPLIAAGAGIGLLSTAFYTISFPSTPEYVGRMHEIGFTDYVETAEQYNIGFQALTMSRFLLGILSLALLAELSEQWARGWRVAAGIAAGIVVCLPLLPVANAFADPDSGFQAAEDTELFTVLREIPPQGSLIAASDLADPGQGYARSLRAPLLSAYGGHALYVANLTYVHAVRPDATERLLGLQAFFGTEWGPWHEQWLARNGITHILVHDRCKPVWRPDGVARLTRLAQAGGWAVYGFESRPPTDVPSKVPGSPHLLQAAYGHAPCLEAESTPWELIRPDVRYWILDTGPESSRARPANLSLLSDSPSAAENRRDLARR